jgi:hypothetical protein
MTRREAGTTTKEYDGYRPRFQLKHAEDVVSSVSDNARRALARLDIESTYSQGGYAYGNAYAQFLVELRRSVLSIARRTAQSPIETP